MAEFGYKEMRKTEVGTHELLTECFNGTEDCETDADYMQMVFDNYIKILEESDEATFYGAICGFAEILDHFGYDVVKREEEA